MADHKIILKNGHFEVKTDDPFEQPKGEDDYRTGYLMLIKRYGGGDVDLVGPKSKKVDVIGALYDLYQTDDTFKEGDTFSYRGKVIARTESFHVFGVGKGYEDFNG